MASTHHHAAPTHLSDVHGVHDVPPGAGAQFAGLHGHQFGVHWCQPGGAAVDPLAVTLRLEHHLHQGGVHLGHARRQPLPCQRSTGRGRQSGFVALAEVIEGDSLRLSVSSYHSEAQATNAVWSSNTSPSRQTEADTDAYLGFEEPYPSAKFYRKQTSPPSVRFGSTTQYHSLDHNSLTCDIQRRLPHSVR